jgi:uncharacterized membrane protein YtjA (UPF0391 family)
MFRIAVLFLCVALLAGLIGFGIVANYTWPEAKILCYVFLALSAASFAWGWWNRPAAV